MSYYIRQANTYLQTDNKAVDIKDKLPAGTYALKFNEVAGQFFFEIADDFEIPSKLYGDCESNADRIINTFKDRPLSTGVLLEGEKGSGKTLLAKVVSRKLIQEGIPTVIINTEFAGERFNTFIQQMHQPALILFDEFEKVYSAEMQTQVLTLFDGVYPTKKLFMITSNDKYRIDVHMRNRPGRIFYMLSFKGLERSFIEEYALEKLEDKSQLSSVITVSVLFPNFNFDMLKALIEEMNRYGETAQQVMRMLNAKPENGGDFFDVKLIVNGEALNPNHVQKTWNGNPLGSVIFIEFDNEDEKDEDGYKNYQFGGNTLKKIEAEEGKFVYVNDDGDTLVLTKKKFETVNWQDLL